MVFILIQISKNIQGEIAELLLDLVDQMGTILNVHLAERNSFLEQIGEEFAAHIHTFHTFEDYLPVYKRNNLQLYCLSWRTCVKEKPLSTSKPVRECLQMCESGRVERCFVKAQLGAGEE